MGCPSSCLTCVLNTFNTLWGIGSFLILLAAVFSIGEAPIFLLCLMFLIGGIGLVSSILGCCGTCNENIKLTKTYAILIGVSLLIQIIALIVVSTTNILQKYGENEINEYWELEIKQQGGMDKPQIKYHCCGKDDPSDYITKLHRAGTIYPDSCFPRQIFNQSALFTTGCTREASLYYEGVFKNITGGSWGSIIFTIIMLLIAIYLVIRFTKRQSSRRYNYNECPMK